MMSMHTSREPYPHQPQQQCLQRKVQLLSLAQHLAQRFNNYSFILPPVQLKYFFWGFLFELQFRIFRIIFLTILAQNIIYLVNQDTIQLNLTPSEYLKLCFQRFYSSL